MEYATGKTDSEALIDPFELDDFGTIVDDEYLSRWNDYIDSADIDDWDEDDQADADAIAASAVFAEDNWQDHFMRRLILDGRGEKIDWQNPEITKFQSEVEGKFAISEMLDRELKWRQTLN